MASLSFFFSCAYLRPLIHCRSVCTRRGLYTTSCLRQSSADHKTPDMYAERIEVHKEKMSAPYGSWKSPITADIVSGADKRLGGFALDGEGRVIWLEGRPTEAGRSVLVREAAGAGGAAEDITPAGFNVRSLVHEYGGGAFTVSGDVVVFSNYKDQRLYKQSIKGDHAPIALTPDYGAPVVRYADGVMDLHLGCYITVREDHRESDTNPTMTIVSVELNGASIAAEPHVLVSGSDFYAFPRLTPDGGKMAWIEWNHPHMPWDKSELWVGYMSAEGRVEKRICIAGNDPNMIESPTEPKWSSQGELFFVTDRKSGFWNLYKWVESTSEVQALYPLDAEFTRPSWVFGNSSYAFIEHKGQNNNIACSYRQKGVSYLGILDHVLGSFSLVDLPFTDIYNITSIGSHLYLEGASPRHPLSIVKVSYEENPVAVRSISIIWSSSSLNIPKYSAFISSPEIIEFSTKVPGQMAFAHLYLPSNFNYQAPAGEKPPLLVKSHGGPTGESHSALDLSIQYWTSRGWAFADVNYGGSTGYGREYRERLNGSWGIVDVNDCCSCAEFLVTAGKVDGERLCITGRSAGGYTTLAALVFRETFKAGASLFGVADLSLLKADTHKFESYYTDSLVGKDESLLYERSPINFVDRLSCPIILFQGLEDKVVPPEQARKIYAAVKEKGLPVALVEYEGEQHGFRKGCIICLILCFWLGFNCPCQGCIICFILAFGWALAARVRIYFAAPSQEKQMDQKYVSQLYKFFHQIHEQEASLLNIQAQFLRLPTFPLYWLRPTLQLLKRIKAFMHLLIHVHERDANIKLRAYYLDCVPTLDINWCYRCHTTSCVYD